MAMKLDPLCVTKRTFNRLTAGKEILIHRCYEQRDDSFGKSSNDIRKEEEEEEFFKVFS